MSDYLLGDETRSPVKTSFSKVLLSLYNAPPSPSNPHMVVCLRKDVQEAIKQLQRLTDISNQLLHELKTSKFKNKQICYENNTLRDKLVNDPHRKTKARIKEVVNHYESVARGDSQLSVLNKPMEELRRLL